MTVHPEITDLVITHKNLDKYLDILSKEPSLQPGPKAPSFTGKEWFHTTVILEYPLGELATGEPFQVLILTGGMGPQAQQNMATLPLTGQEGFDAQGLEGKAQSKREMFQALMALRDTLPKNRGRIITDPNLLGQQVGANQSIKHRHIK